MIAACRGEADAQSAIVMKLASTQTSLFMRASPAYASLSCGSVTLAGRQLKPLSALKGNLPITALWPGEFASILPSMGGVQLQGSIGSPRRLIISDIYPQPAGAALASSS